MGLLQKAVETYDAMASRAGIVHEDEKEPLAPISHIIAPTHIEITLDQDGKFVSARAVGDRNPKLLFPQQKNPLEAGVEQSLHPIPFVMK